MITWNQLDGLSGAEVYEIFLLRQKVFMLEQDCLYQDIDQADAAALHCRYLSDNQQLLGYLRVLPPSENLEVAIGRVAVRKKARGSGIAREMMIAAIKKCRELYPGQSIRIAAQQYLLDFYSSLGFTEIGPGYIEDEIPHQDMILKS